jgi:phosphate acetyltransferase
MSLLQSLKDRARAHPQHIVLPEGDDPRVQQAATQIAREGFARVTLLARGADKPAGVDLIAPAASEKLDAYARIYYERV